MSRMSDDTPRGWQTHASADASRVSTRRGEWVPLMTRLILADLEIDLDGIRYSHLTYSERAVLATSFVDAAAERLAGMGVA